MILVGTNTKNEERLAPMQKKSISNSMHGEIIYIRLFRNEDTTEAGFLKDNVKP